MSKLLQEKELYRRKIARARRISKIRRKKRIDKFLKKRVYTIIVFLMLIIILMTFIIGKLNNFIGEQHKNIEFTKEIIEKVEPDKLLQMNEELLEVIDSLQISIFVYHRRHQQDCKDIQDLLYRAPKEKKKIKERDRSLKYEEDSSNYEFFPDSGEYYIDESTGDTVKVAE